MLPCAVSIPWVLKWSSCICFELLRLLDVGLMLEETSLTQKFHITGNHKNINTVTPDCIACKCVAGQPRLPLLGQLPRERLNPGIAFDKVRVDYVGPIMVESGPIHRSEIMKAYMCISCCSL